MTVVSQDNSPSDRWQWSARTIVQVTSDIGQPGLLCKWPVTVVSHDNRASGRNTVETRRHCMQLADLQGKQLCKMVYSIMWRKETSATGTCDYNGVATNKMVMSVGIWPNRSSSEKRNCRNKSTMIWSKETKRLHSNVLSTLNVNTNLCLWSFALTKKRWEEETKTAQRLSSLKSTILPVVEKFLNCWILPCHCLQFETSQSSCVLARPVI